MQKSKKKIAILLAVTIGFFLLFANLFILLETGHDCVGENCTVCHVLDTCKKVQDNFVTTATVETALVALYFVFVAVLELNNKVYEIITLVTLKTKISN